MSARRATRAIVARLDADFCDELVRGEVQYDLPPANGESEAAQKQRRDMHRRREAALRALDGVAAVEHRTLKARQQQALTEILTAVSRFS